MIRSLQAWTAREASVESGQVIYVVGAGSIGMPLAALLTSSGAQAVAVRTSRDDMSESGHRANHPRAVRRPAVGGVAERARC